MPRYTPSRPSLAVLVAQGLVFELQVNPHQLMQAKDASIEVPGLKVVLNHMVWISVCSTDSVTPLPRLPVVVRVHRPRT